MAYDIVDFGWLGDLPKQFRDERRRATRERTLADLGRGGDLDYGRAGTALLAAGDTEGGVSLARLAEARSIARPIRPGGARRPSARSAMPIGPTACTSASSTRRSRARGSPPGFRRRSRWDFMFIPGGPADPSYRRSVGDRRNPDATAGHAIDPPAGGANVSGFAEPTTLITGLIGDRLMARALSATCHRRAAGALVASLFGAGATAVGAQHGRLRDGVTQSRQHHVRSPRHELHAGRHSARDAGSSAGTRRGRIARSRTLAVSRMRCSASTRQRVHSISPRNARVGTCCRESPHLPCAATARGAWLPPGAVRPPKTFCSETGTRPSRAGVR